MDATDHDLGWLFDLLDALDLDELGDWKVDTEVFLDLGLRYTLNTFYLRTSKV